MGMEIRITIQGGRCSCSPCPVAAGAGCGECGKCQHEEERRCPYSCHGLPPVPAGAAAGCQEMRRMRGLFTPGSNRAKYCPECAGRMKRIKVTQRKRKQRAKCILMIIWLNMILESSAYTLCTPGRKLEEAVIPVLSSEVATRSFCLHNCRGQLVNVPDVHSLKHGPLKIPSCKRDFYSYYGSLNANQLRDSFTSHSLLPQSPSWLCTGGRYGKC